MAETKFDTTITDKETYKTPKLVDSKKYEKLTDDEKSIFIYVRNSMLEIFPTVNNVHSEDCLKFAENFGFIMLAGMEKLVNTLVETKIKESEKRIKDYVVETDKTNTDSILGTIEKTYAKIGALSSSTTATTS